MLKLKYKKDRKKGRIKKIKLGFYAYTYVRTTVMKSLLFKKEDYHKMLKMGFNEIARLLQDSHYKKEINELAAELSGADLIELALSRNLAESFNKLVRISSPEIALLIKEYIKRKDIEDIKTIIRGKFTNTNEEFILNSLTSAGTLSYDFLVLLLKKESIEDILKSNEIVDFSLFKESLKELSEKKNLISIENIFDKYYYAHLMQFSQALPREGKLFRNFLHKEVEILDIMTLLRLKKAKFDKQLIKDFIIPSGNKLKDSKLMKLAEVDDLEEFPKTLENADYKNMLSNGIEEFKKSNSLIALENELYKYLLQQTTLFMHQHPLTIDTILGYMFAKDIEVRNLKIIVKGKQLGLSDEFIERQLVF